MNHVEELFRLAKKLAHTSPSVLGYPKESGISSPEMHSIAPARHLLVGTERQFHKWAREIRQNIVSRMFEFRDRVTARRQDEGLDELCRRFFRENSDLPSLIWASGVWVRTGNWLQRVGLIPKDESCPTEWHSASSAAHATCEMRFGNGESIEIPIRKLHFFYPEPSPTLLLTPRFRRIYTPADREVGYAYEEGLGLGNPDEVIELGRGNYRPNQLFSHTEHGTSYLELLTVTLARFFPDPPSAVPDLRRFTLGGAASNRMRGLHAVPGANLADLWGNAPDEEAALPKRAMVRFVRLTFNPVDLSIVVVLTAERVFYRFVAEHDGLAQLLYERFAARGAY